MIAAMPMGVETIEQIASGNHDAMAQLYDETSSLVYGLALRIVRDPAVAEEVAMDVYMQVWRTAAQYSAERGSVKAWLATMARARSIDWLRSSQARPGRESSPIDEAPPLTTLTPGPEQEAIDLSRRQMIRHHMAKLPAEQCRLIEVSFFPVSAILRLRRRWIFHWDGEIANPPGDVRAAGLVSD